jgi:AhpD family alkylhydroperoxidase
MIERIDYSKLNPNAFESIETINKHINSIDEQLRALIELRVSQINGCPYCLEMHSNQARELGESQQRLDCLLAWRESTPLYSKKERAALEWAEAVTNVKESHIPGETYNTIKTHFSEQEIVDLTLIITYINTWNRIAIGFRDIPDPE